MVAAAPLAGYAVGAVAVGAAMLFRLRRMTRARPLRLERLWIVPALMLVGVVAFLAATPPSASGWIWLVPAAVAGGGLGWIRGRLMTITVHPETHALDVRASPAALMFIVALVLVRTVLRSALMTSAGPAFGVATLTDALLVFAAALLIVQRVEMGLRARRLLAEARGRKTAVA